MFCNSCARPGAKLHVDSGLHLCTRCRRSLKSAAKEAGISVRERWQSMFTRTTKRR